MCHRLQRLGKARHHKVKAYLRVQPGRNSVLHLPRPHLPRPPRRPQARQGAASARWTRRPAASRLMPSRRWPTPRPSGPLECTRSRWTAGDGAAQVQLLPIPKMARGPSSALRPPPLSSACKPRPTLPLQTLAATWLREGGPGHPEAAAPGRWGWAPGGDRAAVCHQLQSSPVFRFACLSPILSQAGASQPTLPPSSHPLLGPRGVER